MSQAGLCSKESCPPLQVATSCEPTPVKEQHPEKISLALEPESAAIYCQKMLKHQIAPFCEVNAPFTASNYLIVDIGGGTLDISALHLEKKPQAHVSVIHPPTGNDCGGSRVNKEFRAFLEKLVRDTGFEQFLRSNEESVNIKNKISLYVLLNETFERQKVLFDEEQHRAEDSVFIIELPYDFVKTYKSDIIESIQYRDDTEVELVGQDLRISANTMGQYFKPIIDGIIECIKQTLDEVDHIETMYLVGGFGGCKFVFRAIKKCFVGRKINYAVPIEPDVTVVRGAVLYKQYPDVIESRKVDATYGVSVASSFIDGLHDPKYQWVNDDGKRRSNSLFSTIVERGDVVGSGEVFVETLFPVVHNQTSMSLKFYSSQQKDIFYVTGEWGMNNRKKSPAVVRKIGNIIISMPDTTGDKSRAVDVTFDFSHTEIQVKVFDRTSKTEVKTTLDFLTASDNSA